MRSSVLAAVMVLLVVAAAHAVERVPVHEVNIDAFSIDTQVGFEGVPADHVAVAWWIPPEFWEAIFTQDETMSETDLEAMLEAVHGTSLLAVVQADISYFGAFNYYGKETILGEMSLAFTDADGRHREMAPMSKLSQDLKLMLSVFTPILGAAMGDLGNNMHFYVLDDLTSHGRLMDPAEPGILDIELKSKEGDVMAGRLELPVNAMFVPRKCPNGKDAHVSWVYCPWTGEKLPE